MLTNFRSEHQGTDKTKLRTITLVYRKELYNNVVKTIKNAPHARTWNVASKEVPTRVLQTINTGLSTLNSSEYLLLLKLTICRADTEGPKQQPQNSCNDELDIL